MSLLGGPFKETRVHVALGVLLFGLLVVLLFLSRDTGQKEFDEANRRLDNFGTVSLRLDGEVFALLFELQVSFDALTELQKELRDAAARLDDLRQSPESETLVKITEERMIMVEDFKSHHAVLRNSRAIARELFAELWARSNTDAQGRVQDLFAVERAFLEYVGRRDAPSAAALRATIADVKSRNFDLAAEPEWRALTTHVLDLVQRSDAIGQLMLSMSMLPIFQTIDAESDAIIFSLHSQSAAAAHYRTTLFILAVLLLAFSAAKVAQVRHHVRAIESANSVLEERVNERTLDLTRANEGLLCEIQHREEVESQLRIAQKLESVGQLAAGVAHEINTPTQYVSDNLAFLAGVWDDVLRLVDDYEFSVVNGGVNDVRSRKIWAALDVPFLRAEVPSALEEASRGLQQISTMVLAMGSFSSPSGEQLQPADINVAIENTIAVARSEWKYVAQLTQELDPSLPPVLCNVAAISHVVLSLVLNAAQAIGSSPERRQLGHIHVSSRRVVDYAEISIEDDGPGVPAEIEDRIFDPFFTTKEVGKGKGQGLAIAYRVIAHQHSGTLIHEAGSGGKGARFVIRLPLMDEQQETGNRRFASVFASGET